MSKSISGAVVEHLRKRANDPEVLAACARAAYSDRGSKTVAQGAIREFLRIVADEDS